MLLNKIQDIKKIAEHRILLRLDLNVPLRGSRVEASEAWRIERALPTINYLIKQKTRIIIVAHLGRPEGKIVPSMSLAPVAKYLAQKLGQKVELWDHDWAQNEMASHHLINGQVVMLENIRFQPREQLNCRRLARNLARLADIYVSDAFGNVHRKDSSMLAITDYLPSYAGLLLQDEISYLESASQATSGLALIMGGAKMETKIKLIKKFVQKGPVLLGGALANTMLLARRYPVGQSLVDRGAGLKLAERLPHKNIYLPSDVVVAANPKASKYQTVAIDQVSKKGYIMDLGEQTIKNYLHILRGKKIIIWNGPLGYFENKVFQKASRQLALAISKMKSKSIVGGGETVAMLREMKLEKKFSFISTGGGAMLSFLQGEKLPALSALIKK